MICFSCGTRYDETPECPAVGNAGFCSGECLDADNKKLAEGNEIIRTAEVQLSDLNKLRLDVSGTTGQMLGSMIRFGRQNNNNINGEAGHSVSFETKIDSDDKNQKG